ncbi:MAG: ArnT family glycosyltransferase, partial [Candidatus Hodarchaeota archaeon]
PEKAMTPSTVKARIKDHLLSARFAILVFALSFFLKLWETSSIKMWDEGWYADISARMADTMENGGDWAYPVYMEFGLLRVFDKPPLIFWVTGFLIIFLGRSTLALKLPIAFSGAMLAAIAYFLYSGDRNDRTAGALAGLMMAAAYFVNFYSRTAYIDITMVFLSSLTVLFAKRSIDAFLDHENAIQGSIFLIFTGLVNALNLLLKAWQGLVVGPALGIYLLVKVYQRETDTPQTLETLESLGSFEKLQQLLVSFPKDPRRVQILAAIIAFSGAYLIFIGTNEWLLTGLLLLFPLIGVLFVILLVSSFPKDKLPSPLDLSLVGVVLGILSVLILRIIVGFIEPYYQVLEDLAHGIGDSAGGYAILYLGLPEELFGKSSKEQLGDLLSGIFSLVPILVVVASLSVIVACFAMIELGILGEPRYQRLIKGNLLPILPVLLLGFWIAFWATQIMLGGFLFDHEPIPTVLSGLMGGVFIFTFFSVLGLMNSDKTRKSIGGQGQTWRKYQRRALQGGISFIIALAGVAIATGSFLFLYTVFNWDPWLGVTLSIGLVLGFLLTLVAIFSNRTSFWLRELLGKANSSLFLTGFAVIVAVLSFLPFLAWLDYVSRNLGKLSYLDSNRPVRRPGELPEAVYQEHKDDILRWFFFDYYISWRYENPSPNEDYNMWNAIHSAFADPIFVAMIPVFFIGVFAFFRTKSAADGLLYTTWFFSTLLVFLPAAFQLNYYYLACFLPFYMVVAKGLVFMFQEARAWWAFEYLAVFIGVLTFGFIIHHYFIITYELLSIPALGVETRIMPSGPHLQKLDLLALTFGIITSFLILFWIRKSLNIIGLTLVFVIVLSSLIAISYSIHAGAKWDPRLEEIADFILEHNGDYNESTWVFSDAGTEYGLRYYLGYEVFKEGERWVGGSWVNPFKDNSSTRIETFVNAFPQIKFWIVLNDTYRDHDTPETTHAYYSEAYLWLKENYVCVDDQIGIPEWLAYHVFADPSVL